MPLEHDVQNVLAKISTSVLWDNETMAALGHK